MNHRKIAFALATVLFLVTSCASRPGVPDKTLMGAAGGAAVGCLMTFIFCPAGAVAGAIYGGLAGGAADVVEEVTSPPANEMTDEQRLKNMEQEIKQLRADRKKETEELSD